MIEYEKYLPFIAILLSLAFGEYQRRKGKTDKVDEKRGEESVELTKAHLSEAAEFRKDIKADKDALKTELKAEIKELKIEVKEKDIIIKERDAAISEMSEDISTIIKNQQRLVKSIETDRETTKLLENNLNKVNQKLNSLQKSQRDLVSHYESTLAQKDKEQRLLIKEHNTQLCEKDEIIKELQETVSSQGADIERLKKTLAENNITAHIDD